MDTQTHEPIGELLADCLSQALQARGIPEAAALAAAAHARVTGDVVAAQSLLAGHLAGDRGRATAAMQGAIAAIAGSEGLRRALAARQTAERAGRMRATILEKMAMADATLYTDSQADAEYAAGGYRESASANRRERRIASARESWLRRTLGDEYDPPLTCGQSESDDTVLDRLALTPHDSTGRMITTSQPADHPRRNPTTHKGTIGVQEPATDDSRLRNRAAEIDRQNALAHNAQVEPAAYHESYPRGCASAYPRDYSGTAMAELAMRDAAARRAPCKGDLRRAAAGIA